MSQEPDEPRRLGGALRLERETCRTYWFEGAVYVVDVVGKLTVEDLRPTIDTIYRDPATLEPHAVLFHDGRGADYHRSVLTFYEQDVPRPMPAMVGVVARRSGVRMVATAAGLGFRAFTRVQFAVFGDLIGGLIAGRLAVGQARQRD